MFYSKSKDPSKAIDQALEEFKNQGWLDSHSLTLNDFEREYLPAPHRPRSLTVKEMAVFAFFYEGECLLVGYAGANSSPRFLSQHYNAGSSGSNLARHILQDESIASDIDERLVGHWIKQNCYRVNILIPASKDTEILKGLTDFLRVKFNPRFGR